MWNYCRIAVGEDGSGLKDGIRTQSTVVGAASCNDRDSRGGRHGACAKISC